MTNFAYTRNIPASNHNPAVDQPSMQTNTNSTSDLIAEDHFTFGVANGGFHKQIRLPDLAAIGNLAPRVANSGTLWTQLADSIAPTQESNLFYVPDLTADSYQLTRTITSKKTLFGKLTSHYPGSPSSSFSGGWTFLPGGMLYQYGFVQPQSGNTTIIFPVPFASSPFSIQVTYVQDNNSTLRGSGVLSGSESATQFTTNNTSDAHITRIYWTAIGV